MDKAKLTGILILFILSINLSLANVNEIILENNMDGSYNIEENTIHKFTVTNTKNTLQSIKIIRQINPEETLVSYPNAIIKYMQLEHMEIPYLEYDIDLQKNQEKQFEVKVKYDYLPYNGKVILPSIFVKDSKTERLVGKSMYEVIQIECKIDNICDKKVKENSLNCPEDCQSGEEDGICDMKEDGKCDPNCLTYLDSDCEEGEGIIKIPEIPKKEIIEKKTKSKIKITQEEINKVIENFEKNNFGIQKEIKKSQETLLNKIIKFFKETML